MCAVILLSMYVMSENPLASNPAVIFADNLSNDCVHQLNSLVDKLIRTHTRWTHTRSGRLNAIMFSNI